MTKTLKLLSTLFLLTIFLVIILEIASALVIDSITSLKEISPGEVIDIEIALKNNGDQLVEDVSISLDLTNMPFIPFESSSEDSISEIREDKIKNARFTLQSLTSAVPGVYKIPLKITYKEEGNPEIIIKNSLVSITVNSTPIISAQLVEPFIIKNQDNDVIIKIVNKGVGNLKFLEIEMLPSSHLIFLSPMKLYIGDLDSDDFDNIELKIFAKSTAPERINMKMKVIYKDELNKEYKEEIELPITIYSKDKAISLGLIKKSYTLEITILVALLIVFYFFYKYLKKMLNKREKL